MRTPLDLAGGRVTIDLGALVSNWQLLNEKSGAAECGAVVKANAYGCRIEPVVKALAEAGCGTFFVALPQEGARVKNTAPDVRCFVLGGLFENSAPYLLEHDLIPVLNSMPEIDAWCAVAKMQGKPLPCAIQIDTGMNRLGLSLEEFLAVASNETILEKLDPKLLMTHYACADDRGSEKTANQRTVFTKACQLLPDIPRSAANSAAILQENGHEFELTRPGIALYGGEALNDAANPMKPVAHLEARIIQIRQANAGDGVGYGAAEILKRDTRIAYVAVGYADGYHRASSNKGVPTNQVTSPAKAAFNGHILNGIGRISMDMCAFDVTDIPEGEISAGDWIELFGNNILVDDVARAAGTIGYELLTGLGSRYAVTFLEPDT